MITRTEVPEDQRLNTLPKHFGRNMLKVEAAVYTFTRRLCKNYTGGYWKFYELDNGGFYMAPDIEGELNIAWVENYYSGKMSADALGITACLFALSHLSFQITRDSDKVADHFYWLRDYASQHSEASEIFAAID